MVLRTSPGSGVNTWPQYVHCHSCTSSNLFRRVPFRTSFLQPQCGHASGCFRVAGLRWRVRRCVAGARRWSRTAVASERRAGADIRLLGCTQYIAGRAACHGFGTFSRGGRGTDLGRVVECKLDERRVTDLAAMLRSLARCCAIGARSVRLCSVVAAARRVILVPCLCLGASSLALPCCVGGCGTKRRLFC